MRVKKYGANTVRAATGNFGKIAFFQVHTKPCRCKASTLIFRKTTEISLPQVPNVKEV